MEKKYYEAYNERYKEVHKRGCLWTSTEATPDVLNWISDNNIGKDEPILEVGCGEGRDALYLAELGYSITALDISEEAIRTCSELSKARNINVEWICGNMIDEGCLKDRSFKWIYSVGTLHMLVEDEDRNAFLRSLYRLLTDDGSLLLINMGDGTLRYKSDVSTAFDLQERKNINNGRIFMVAGTSCRIVDYNEHMAELKNAGFEIEDFKITKNNEHGTCMAVRLVK